MLNLWLKQKMSKKATAMILTLRRDAFTEIVTVKAALDHWEIWYGQAHLEMFSTLNLNQIMFVSLIWHIWPHQPKYWKVRKVQLIGCFWMVCEIAKPDKLKNILILSFKSLSRFTGSWKLRIIRGLKEEQWRFEEDPSNNTSIRIVVNQLKSESGGSQVTLQ